MSKGEDVEMMPSGEFKFDERSLETVKNMVIDQEVLLTTYTDQWELLYSDFATCVKIMLSFEQKKG